MIFAAILAGGKGTRTGVDIPKQFLVFGDKPILIQTLEVFVDAEVCDYIYISVNEMWRDYTEELLQKYFEKEVLEKVRIVLGGKERMMSFLNVIYDIRDTFGIHDTDIILSHDAVRPFVTKKIIMDCIEKTKESRVAMAAIPSADTTYAALKEGFLTSTYDRKTLFLGQTPQGCKMDFMYEVISSYTEDELLAMTGTSQLFINRNINVRISLGSVDNMKITTFNDLEFLEFKFNKAGGK